MKHFMKQDFSGRHSEQYRFDEIIHDNSYCHISFLANRLCNLDKCFK